MSDQRPEPEVLLRRIRDAEARGRRGRLKVFFGAAPGVGKTYAMLSAARARQAAGTDVVIGWIETHGRAETEALTQGIERLAPCQFEHRGLVLREFDLDAALARRPQLLLLDELAHTNAPGSRHARRWQDAVELLDAGIDVWTTFNVQHLESLNDVVARVTGVVVRETLPDLVLDQADEVECVDLPPQDLLRRLAEGKVYVPDQARRAARAFFRQGNLTALRELALRRTAEHVDSAVRGYRLDHAIDTTWPVAERVLVCIRPNPESGRLVRSARRLAARLRAEWIVVWVESPGQPALSETERRHLAQAFALADQLGAQTTTISGPSVSEAVLRYARERNVSTLLVGKPAHPRWRDRLRGSLVDDIVRASGEIDVFVISGDDAAAPPTPTVAASRTGALRGYFASALAVLAASLACAAAGGRFDNSNLVMVYLLAVVFVATRHGRGPSAFAAIASVASFDFFFVPPHLTFAVADTQYLVTFGVMLVVGLLVSTLAARVRDSARLALQRERRTQALYALSRELTGLRSEGEVARAAARRIAELFHGPAAVLLPDSAGRLEAVDPSPAFAADERERAVAQWAFDHGRPAGADTDTLAGAAALYEPLLGSRGPVGVLALALPPPSRPLGPDQRELLGALARQVASPLESARTASQMEEARLAAESERLRSTLLSSVSHDLRTPLTAITGAASAALDVLEPPQTLARELVSTILEEADRLNRLVGNLLDMTRLEAGTLEPKRDWHSLEEVVGSAVARVERTAGAGRLAVQIEPDLPLVPLDAVLIEQALVNLLENAIRHGGPQAGVWVDVRKDAQRVLVEVADDGPGFPPQDALRIFEKFYRATGGSGAGLGLAIVRAIVTAHGGSIRAWPRRPRGACFELALPLAEAPPPLPAEEPA